MTMRELRMEIALRRIAKWFGEFPDPVEKHSDGSPVTFGFLFGSNGERDYMRKIAQDVLNEAKEKS